ncbi:hypothetical protein GCM10023328_04600 [Modestobacter marinus]|uniref:Lipoprotein n=1 Tax=Modestobacter marinus TaxID=477641 RepID=A0A846LHR7_9ACTN|nr:hypothetical protein [Modestobacter marinus]NIH67117.1 hypothetical protein [Modestobacter marinus]GGL52161.1 hypothetical protein GCM10011589_05360 [Modestobacter marinus]
MSTSRSNRVKAAIGTVSLTGAAMGFMSGCAVGGEEQEAERVYCVDEQDQVVDEEQCEEAERNGGFVGGVPFFFLLGGFGGNRYSVGQTIPQQYTGAATRVNPSDTTARSRAGLPGSGRVTSGTRISGGIGTGGGRVGSGSVGS